MFGTCVRVSRRGDQIGSIGKKKKKKGCSDGGTGWNENRGEKGRKRKGTRSCADQALGLLILELAAKCDRSYMLSERVGSLKRDMASATDGRGQNIRKKMSSLAWRAPLAPPLSPQ